MKVTLDGSEFALGDGMKGGDKRAIYDAVRAAAAKDGRVITSLSVDGNEISDVDAFCAISGGQTIEFTSQAVRSLVNESAAEGTRYLSALMPGVSDIATKFERGEDDAAHRMLSDAVEGINWIFGIFEKICGITGITAESLKAGKFSEDSEHIKEALTEMNTAMEAGDGMKLAYIIRSKLAPVLEKFKGYWDEVVSTIDGAVH